MALNNVQKKRQKQKEPRKTNKFAAATTNTTTTTTIQSFFTVKAKPAEVCTAPEPMVDESDMDDNSSTKLESSIRPIPFPNQPLFKQKGIPAPFPTEVTHVPAPVYSRFTYKDNDVERRYPAKLLDQAVATPSEPIDNKNCAKWRGLDGKPRCWLKDSNDVEPVLDNALMSIGIRAMPANVSKPYKCPMPQIPLHLQHLEPIMSLLSGDVDSSTCNGGSNQTTQLLSSRHCPKRAREVLGNRQAVAQLHSWIEGMRIGRVASTTMEKEDIHSYNSSDFSDSGMSSDDFMPPVPSKTKGKPPKFVKESKGKMKRRRRKRQTRGDKQMDDIYAWANSNGTLNSVRENLYVSQRYNRQRSNGNGSGCESELFSNVVLLCGPSGSCKTASVYACAAECGFQVQEIHPGQRRSGKDVLELLEDAISSHTISSSAQQGNQQQQGKIVINQVLILIEQIDVLFDQDQRLWPALKQLALKSKRPIVLTCTDTTCIRWDLDCFHSVLCFSRPTTSVAVPYLFLLCLTEGILVAPADIEDVYQKSSSDINRVFSSLEVVMQQTRAASYSIEEVVQQEPCAVDLGGTLAWLLNPLERGETPVSRYGFWSELVCSAQSDSVKEAWFKLWPDLPPPVLLPVTDDISKAVDQNSLFSQGRNANGLPQPDIIDQKDSMDVEAPQLIVCILPSSFATSVSSNRSNQIGYSSNTLSELEQLDQVALYLDAQSSNDSHLDELLGECSLEPLYSPEAPMTDGCLEINYVMLESNVLTRHNSSLNLDGLCSGRGTKAWISQAIQELTTTANSESIPYTCQYETKPVSQYSPLPDNNQTWQCLGEASFFASTDRRYCRDIVATLEEAFYLGIMIKWDKIHQSMPRKQPFSETTDFGWEHFNRIGTRRTRMNTYRPHVKDVPDALQSSLRSWIEWF